MSSLSVSSGSLSPSFSSNITDYTTSVANSVSSITVTLSATDPNSTITVNGTSATSPVSLAVGSKTITVIVTPEYGATKTYTITVTRAAPQPPAIASISPNSGSSSGGTAVTITGADLSNVTSVKFGTTAASSFTVISATSITATTPAHTVGAVDVVVSDGTNTSTLSNAFTYEPALSFSPAAGTLTATNVGANYRQTITTSGGTEPYSYGVSGTLPATLSIDPQTGIIEGTPTTQGNFSFSVTVTDANQATASVAYTLNVKPQAPIANPVTAPVAANSSSNIITLNIMGGTATGVAVASQASHGTATASGTSITYTPTTGYSGSDSFTYTATNDGGTSSPATVSITVTAPAPTFTFSPAAGTLTPGTVGTSYTQTITASGGSGTYTYAVTWGTLPKGFTFDPTTGLLSGTPTTAKNYSFTIAATDANNVTSTGTYNLAIAAAIPALTANPVNVNVAANSSSNIITLNIMGGTATGVAVASQASHGTATASGTSITYTPTTGYSGSDSFTYTATNDGGTSTPATVSITITAPAPTFTFSPAAGTLTPGTVGTSYTQTITASGGSGTYTYAVTSGTLPTGFTVDPTTGLLSGTPTTARNYSFTIAATDANNVTSTVTYNLAIAAAIPAPIANPVTAPVAANSSSNNITLNITGGTATGVAVASQASHGTATASGTSITYTPTTGYSGSDSFTYTATNNGGTSTPATVSITVTAPAPTFTFSPAAGALPDAMAGEEYEQQINVSGGTSPLTFSVLPGTGTLPNGLVLSQSGELSGTLAANTQNDYTFTVKVMDTNGAEATAIYTLKVKQRAVSVSDQVVDVPSGSAPPDTRLDKRATGGPFNSGQLVSVQPPNAGTATLTMGDYAQVGPVAPVGWYLKFTPTTGYSGSVVITFSLTSGLGSSTGTVTYNLSYDPAKVVTQIDGEVRDFVKSRQSMISSAINVPGLLERRNAESAKEPVTTRISPSSNGMTLGFSTSLAQLEAARNNADSPSINGPGEIAPSPFNIWLNGTLMLHNRPANDNEWGSFAMLSAGADYLITDKALVGMSFHLDRMTDPTADGSELTGNGWLAGPYTSFEIGKGVFWDTSLLYGGSANDIDTEFWDGEFDSRRWMAETSIKGQWYLDSTTVLTPKLRAVYFSEDIGDYTVSNANGDALTLGGFTSEQLRVSFGGEIAREYTLSNDTKLKPKIGLTGGFSGIDGSGEFGSVSTGVSLATVNEWTIDFSLLFNIEGNGDKSGGARGRISKRF
ncbi:putative Ig domain-containing protein [Rhizobium skierniewicense]|uniref:putative Ig domain-containing protein n=1 Tax=Rhizobium skierniewicense TaxID=984260 RepID=UPI001FAE6F8A|nr:putative Ig domain-containing protein [Rhizobium skierniewicense]MCI9866919.1 putative Ig domain-containing protein [Rhizobium skierniewicense]